MLRLSILVLGIAASALGLVGLTDRARAENPPATAAAAPSSAEHGAAIHAPEAHATTEHAGAEQNPNVLEAQPSLAIWTVVVFVGLLIVLTKYAWRPLIEALHEREHHLEHVLLDTEKARNESERLLAEHRRQMAEAEQRAQALLEEARQQAKLSGEQIVQQARTEAEAEKNRARQEIESARDQALTEIWTKTADLAVLAAGKVLAKELGPDDHRRLVALATTELGTAPPSANGHGGSAQ